MTSEQDGGAGQDRRDEVLPRAGSRFYEGQAAPKPAAPAAERPAQAPAAKQPGKAA